MTTKSGETMQDPRDVISLGVGAATAGIGALGLTAGDVQLVLSIVASTSGIVLTTMTLYWRRGENRRRVKEFKDYQERIERLEDAQEDCSDRDDKDRQAHQDNRDSRARR